MSCENCVSRRAFLAQSAVAAASVALVACGDGQIGGPGITNPTTGKSIKVADFPGLATVGALVTIDGQRAVKRTGTATFAAFSRACTHEGTAVNVVSGGASFLCPNHLSRFDNDGNPTAGPNGTSASTISRLSVLTTAYDPTTDTLTIG
jgi:cytochrome b6-f complex iron-sulfur subunit